MCNHWRKIAPVLLQLLICLFVMVYPWRVENKTAEEEADKPLCEPNGTHARDPLEIQTLNGSDLLKIHMRKPGTFGRTIEEPVRSPMNL